MPTRRRRESHCLGDRLISAPKARNIIARGKREARRPWLRTSKKRQGLKGRNNISPLALCFVITSSCWKLRNNSVQALAKIKETVPNKPIRYLVLTHHHSDQAGGFREYVAEGATIVTTAGNKSFLEKAAALESSLLKTEVSGPK